MLVGYLLKMGGQLRRSWKSTNLSKAVQRVHRWPFTETGGEPVITTNILDSQAKVISIPHFRYICLIEGHVH